ncbi:MAG: DUF882 domain-containing protein [Labilithrix sp.]|nr:DUF882 domain-containing protein [Labilithrix sp.]MCW5815958.1 DUF882 domain-containing protein [Labilithrix sp.]
MAAKSAHGHHAKSAHVQKKVEKKSDKSDKSALVRVKAGKKDGAAIKPVVHHAKDVDVSGAGHHEPGMTPPKKNDHGGALVSASMTTKIAKVDKKAKPGNELPKLPAHVKSGKPSKGGAEKGARKPAKSEPASADDGETSRDEELAELVARIRGVHGDASAKSAPSAQGPKQVSHNAPARPPCTKEPVEIVRGPEAERFELTKCDGTIAPGALERFSVLIRPGGTARPTAPASELAKKPGPDIAPGIKRVDARLVERVQRLADHFGKPGAPARFFVISGYRPASIGSMHSSGRAMDFRVDGMKNEDVVSFCKTINDTGCGYYPNSSFVHMDVREPGTGHTTWIDASGPGESPRYVTQWPEPAKHTSPLDRVTATESIPTTRLEEEGEDLLRARRPTSDDEQPIDSGMVSPF